MRNLLRAKLYTQSLVTVKGILPAASYGVLTPGREALWQKLRFIYHMIFRYFSSYYSTRVGYFDVTYSNMLRYR
jgi:hypothetical protein